MEHRTNCGKNLAKAWYIRTEQPDWNSIPSVSVNRQGQLKYPTKSSGRSTFGTSLGVTGLEQPGSALTASHTHSHDPVTRFPAYHFIGERAHHTRPRHTKRMADRDRSAVDIELRRIDSQTVAAVHNLHRKGFIQFPQIDVVDFQVMALEEFRCSEDRADSHLVRLTPAQFGAAFKVVLLITKKLLRLNRST